MYLQKKTVFEKKYIFDFWRLPNLIYGISKNLVNMVIPEDKINNFFFIKLTDRLFYKLYLKYNLKNVSFSLEL